MTVEQRVLRQLALFGFENCEGNVLILSSFHINPQEQMLQIIQDIKEKSIYRLKTRHHKGFGIHSPYLYRLISAVLEEKWPYYCYNHIESIRELLSNDIRSFNQNNKKDGRCGQLLFRLIQDAQYKTLLELGTSAGLETQYMAFANKKAKCISVTSSVEIAEIVQKSQKHNEKQSIKNIELKILRSGDSFEEIINELDNLDFVYFNEPIGGLKISDLFDYCLKRRNNGSIFVLKKIHMDSERREFWEKIMRQPEVRVTIDLYDMGIVIFNPDLEKNNYVIRL